MGKIRSATSNRPRILFVTPEVSFVPDCSGKNNEYLRYESLGYAGFLSHLVHDLYCLGGDVHITQPDYRNFFSDIFRGTSDMATRKIPGNRVHLTEDRAFFYTKRLQSNDQRENIRISVAFQREVFHHILPLVQPDLIHCHGWMSGLIPAMAKNLAIPCIFSFHSLETGKSLLAEIEDVGIDAAAFWQYLFFDRFPVNYEETRDINPVDFLLSGILAADCASASGPALLIKLDKNSIQCRGAPLGKVPSKKLFIGRSAGTDFQMGIMQYIDLYENLLRRPVIVPDMETSRLQSDFFQDANPFDRSSDMQIGI